MKRTCLLIWMALTAAPLAACTEPALDEPSAPDEPADVATWDVLHQYELRWNAGYTVGNEALRGAYRPRNFPVPALAPTTLEWLLAAPTPALKGYGAVPSHEAFAYVDVDGVTWLHYDGVDLPVLNADWSWFAYPIEEIEIHPGTLEVYALVRVGNAIKLYRIARDPGGFAFAQLMTYSTANAIFHNPVGNGY